MTDTDGAHRRREYLQSLGTAAVAALAGCGSSGSTNTTSETDSQTDTVSPTDSNTSSETPESEWQIDPLEHDQMVAAWYYAWYGGPVNNPFTEYSPSTPELGPYNSRDKAVINQHIKWAREHGINTFISRWGGPDWWDDTTLLDYFFEAELGSEIDLFVEPSVTALTPGDSKAPKDFDKEANRTALIEAFEYLDENYFDRSNYARLDGRPAVAFFSTVGQTAGDFAGALAEAKAATSEEPFVVADAVRLFDPLVDVNVENPEQLYGDLFSVVDALTTYTIYDPDKVAELDFPEYVEHIRELSLNRRLSADSYNIPFIPDVIPGYDDSELPDRPNRPALKATPDRFQQLIDSQKDLINSDLNAIFVTSFNEWYEDTPIEPREEYGTAFLETVADGIARDDKEPLDPATDFNRLQFQFNTTAQPDGSDRNLAWYVSSLTLSSADGESVASYDIGVPEEEPYLIEGVYGIEEAADADPPTRRWFGGPFARTTMYVESQTPTPASATVRGSPIRSDAIEVEVHFDGRLTDTIDLGAREWQTYEFSLTN